MIFIVSGIQAQNLTDFKLVDKFKENNMKVKVYFKDPLKELIKKYPDFDKKDNKTKHKLLSNYLHNNTLYVFQTYRKKELQKSYELKGNPKKIRTKYYFNLDVLQADGTPDKAIDKIGIGGSFFEHMFIFQSPQGKEVIGKGIKMWGYFVMINSYDNIKTKISELINMDAENAIPVDILVKDEKIIQPMFDYQKKGLQFIERRELLITVYEYDSLGNVIDEFVRTEIDTDLYLSATSKDLIGVTSFPYFSKDDVVKTDGNVILINSKLENVNHYLKNIQLITKSESKLVDRIQGEVIIHIYNTSGHSTQDELYIAEFATFGGCNFPKIIKFCPLDDTSHKQPRIKIEIDYKMK